MPPPPAPAPPPAPGSVPVPMKGACRDGKGQIPYARLDHKGPVNFTDCQAKVCLVCTCNVQDGFACFLNCIFQLAYSARSWENAAMRSMLTGHKGANQRVSAAGAVCGATSQLLIRTASFCKFDGVRLLSCRTLSTMKTLTYYRYYEQVLSGYRGTRLSGSSICWRSKHVLSPSAWMLLSALGV